LRKCISRVLVNLLTKFHCLPPSFFISGVDLRSQRPVTSGGFGDIYQGTYEGKTVAIKLFRMYKPANGPLLMNRRFYREAFVWRSLEHPHVLPFYGIDSALFCPGLCIVSPWMENGTLTDHITRSQCSQAIVTKLVSQFA
ncbi:hypothetical protein PUNSTDRAFT_58411, partial [Punctularia strigosozonata HHB-11173 SS5]|uniref:uncharacterized protein n=1 Tax=Punctularia strigosozonata (strain HHB-11173) TaxID=741275 RepID=UPI00044174D8